MRISDWSSDVCSSDLADPAQRDRVLLAAMGSPDARQIDGLGGATTLTSKVAIVSPSKRPGIDVDYLFAQVEVEPARVDTSPPCRSEEQTSELPTIKRSSYAALCLTKT